MLDKVSTERMDVHGEKVQLPDGSRVATRLTCTGHRLWLCLGSKIIVITVASRRASLSGDAVRRTFGTWSISCSLLVEPPLAFWELKRRLISQFFSPSFSLYRTAAIKKKFTIFNSHRICVLLHNECFSTFFLKFAKNPY